MVDEFAEFKKQYEKTFTRIKFEGQEDYHVVFVKQCEVGDGDKKYIVLYNPKIGSTMVNWKDSKQNMDYSFPEIGLFNHKESFLFFHRFPERQWKRGIVGTNAEVNDPLYAVKYQISGLRDCIRSTPIDYHTLTSAFNRVYPEGLIQACVWCQEKSGVALNRVFGITKNPTKDKNLILWKHSSMIGEIDPSTYHIIVHEESFRQEVADFLKRTGETFWNLK